VRNKKFLLCNTLKFDTECHLKKQEKDGYSSLLVYMKSMKHSV